MRARTPQIVAFGGGGFSMEPDNSLLDDYVLSLTGAAAPARLLPADGLRRRRPLRRALLPPLRRRTATPATSRCSGATRAPAASRTTSPAHLLAQDLIYVGGGNVVSMLGAWRAHGLDDVAAPGVAARASCCAARRPARCAGSSEALSAFHGAPRRVRGLGLLPVLQLRPLRRRAAAPRASTTASSATACAAASPPRTASRCTSSAPRCERVVSSRADGRAYRVEHDRRRRRRDAAARRGRSRRAPRARQAARATAGLLARRRSPRRRRSSRWAAGGFTMEPDNPLLDDFVLSLAPARRSRASCSCRPPPATRPRRSTPSTPRFADRACVPEHLSLFRLRDEPPAAARDSLLEQDVIYVGGGSMRNLLAIWQAHGLDQLLRRGLAARRPCWPGSAPGAMCWFEGGVTRSSGPPEPLAGLGLLRGLADRARRRRARAAAGVARAPCATARCPAAGRSTTASGCCSAADALARVVSSRPGAGAQRVDAVAGELVRKRLEPELLGDGAPRVLGGVDEAVQELRRVHRMRRGHERRLRALSRAPCRVRVLRSRCPRRDARRPRRRRPI